MNPSKKISILKDTVIYTFASYIVQAVGVVNSIALRRFMGPEFMGIWSFLQVILGYCGYASFGTTKAMQRDYPYLRGRGENEKAEELKDLTMTFSMLMSVIPAALLAGYLITRWAAIAPALRAGLVFITGFLFVQRFYDIIITLLRSDKKFEVLSKLVVINALAGLAVTFVFVSKWHMGGLLAGTAVAMAGCLFFIFKQAPYRFCFFWNLPAIGQELKLGIPLVISTFLFEFLVSMDKLILAKSIGFFAIGLYSIAMMVSQYIYSIPMMFSHVWYPNLVEEYGRVGTTQGIKPYLVTPVFTLSIIVPFLSGMAMFTLPVIVDWFLPKFQGGLPVMRIYLLGTFFVMLAQFSNQFLITLNKFLLPIPLLLVAIFLNLVLSLCFVHMDLGTRGIALGAALSFFFYGVSIYVFALTHVAGVREIIKNLLTIFAKLLYFSILIYVLDHAIQSHRIFFAAGLKCLIFLIFSLPFFWILEKRTKLFAHILAIVMKKGKPQSPDEEYLPAGTGALS